MKLSFLCVFYNHHCNIVIINEDEHNVLQDALDSSSAAFIVVVYTPVKHREILKADVQLIKPIGTNVERAG